MQDLKAIEETLLNRVGLLKHLVQANSANVQKHWLP